jgi:hypothetical protein
VAGPEGVRAGKDYSGCMSEQPERLPAVGGRRGGGLWRVGCLSGWAGLGWAGRGGAGRGGRGRGGGVVTRRYACAGRAVYEGGAHFVSCTVVLQHRRARGR